jgi:hypothetical protein
VPAAITAAAAEEWLHQRLICGRSSSFTQQVHDPCIIRRPQPLRLPSLCMLLLLLLLLPLPLLLQQRLWMQL